MRAVVMNLLVLSTSSALAPPAYKEICHATEHGTTIPSGEFAGAYGACKIAGDDKRAVVSFGAIPKSSQGDIFNISAEVYSVDASGKVDYSALACPRKTVGPYGPDKTPTEHPIWAAVDCRGKTFGQVGLVIKYGCLSPGQGTSCRVDATEYYCHGPTCHVDRASDRPGAAASVRLAPAPHTNPPLKQCIKIVAPTPSSTISEEFCCTSGYPKPAPPGFTDACCASKSGHVLCTDAVTGSTLLNHTFAGGYGNVAVKLGNVPGKAYVDYSYNAQEMIHIEANASYA